MHKMTKLACLMLALTQGVTPAWAAADKASQVLIEQATYWQQKNRDDLAGDAWRKLLRAEPDHPQALIQLAKIEMRAGNMVAAKSLYERAVKLVPPPAGLNELGSSLQLGTIPQSELDVARKQAQAGQSEAAVKQYKKALQGEQPSGALGLEYYQTLGSTREGWDEARQGLEALAKNHPGDKTYLLALAKHLTYRETTRREGIRQLAALAGSETEAVSAWRQALVWLNASKRDRDLFQAYLARYPDDLSIKSRLAGLNQPARSYHPSAEALARQSGYKSLDSGDLVQAEAKFSAVLSKHPHDADALGGLGLIRLRQASFVAAIDYFDQAKRYDRRGSRRWTKARNSASYWSLVEQANATRDAGDLAGAERYLRSANRLDSTETSAQVLLADLLVEQRRYESAESLYRNVLKRKPRDVNAYAGLLALLIQSDREREARDMLAVYESSPSMQAEGNNLLQAAVLRQMAVLDEKHRDYKMAASRLEDALLLNPYDPWIRVALARQYQKLGYHAEANALLDNLVAAYPDFPEGIHARALLYAEQNGWAEGLRTLELIPPAARTPALQREQRRFWVHAQSLRAQQLFAARQRPAALATMREVERAAGNDKGLLAVTASGWAGIEQADDALRVMRSIMMTSAVHSPDVRIQYAGLLLNARQYVELGALLRSLSAASESLTVAQQKDLNDIILAYTVRQADSLREGGHLADAYRVLKPALDRSDDVRLQMALARLYNTGNDPAAALRVSADVLAREPDDLDNQLFASGMALAVHQNDQALQYAQAALALQPNHPRALAAAGRAERAKGNNDKAMEYFQYAQALEREDQADTDTGLSLRLVGEYPQEARRDMLPVPADVPARRSLLPVPDVLDRGGASLKLSPSVGRYSDASGRAPASLSASPDELPRAFREATPVYVRSAPAMAMPEAASAPIFAADVPAQVAQKSTLSDEIAALRPKSTGDIVAGMGFRNRSGEAGLSSLSEIELAAQYDMLMAEGGQIRLRATPVLLSAGTLNSAAPQSAVRFGSVGLGPFLATPTGVPVQSAAGVALNGAYRKGDMTIDLGTTPLGFKVTDFVGGLSMARKVGSGVGLRVGINRRAVTDSLLSYAGAQDPRTGKAWGGVVKTGLGVSADFDENGKGIYGHMAYSALTGTGVKTNNELELSSGAYMKLYRTEDQEMTLGVNLSFMSYRHNLSYFTLGHGGYFSPQSYVSAALPVDLSGRVDNVVYQLGADVGLRAFRADPIVYYPADPTMQQAWQTQVAALPGYATQYAGSSVTGLGYGLFGSAEMPVGGQIAVGLKLAMDNSSNYSQQTLLAYLRYSFDGLPQPLAFPPQPLRSIAQGGLL